MLLTTHSLIKVNLKICCINNKINKVQLRIPASFYNNAQCYINSKIHVLLKIIKLINNFVKPVFTDFVSLYLNEL